METKLNGLDLSDLYVCDLPENVCTAEIETISVKGLLEQDKDEAKRLFQSCQTYGVFLLDLMDHPKGKRFLSDMADTVRIAQHVFQSKTLEEKRTYTTRPRVGIMDKGYIAEETTPTGEVKSHEVLNVPNYELFSAGAPALELPPWLAPHEAMFRQVATSGNEIANTILACLETQLKLAPVTLTSAHRLEDPSSDFLRLVRHPGFGAREDGERVSFHAHRDLSSLGLLLAPLPGLQVEHPSEPGVFRWVRPKPGTIVVNVGEGLQILTNGVLKGVLHRVVRVPGHLTAVDRVSALVVVRAKGDMPMLPLPSPIIPRLSDEQKQRRIETSDEWAANKLKALTAIRAKEGKMLPKELAFVYKEAGMPVPIGI
ncbi:oxidoreductase [Colletotrichum truncatum]|uniref:Oxidoreductase n=1 Tax=Colletotrichum truncatum TaxID=5467 RepID=A0ACC3Z8W6_COLTU